MTNPVFSKTDFPDAPGGDRYEWKKAEVRFNIPQNGRYVIAVTASCKNGRQNKTGDDDDLRLAINGYEFGKNGDTLSVFGRCKGFGLRRAGAEIL